MNQPLWLTLCELNNNSATLNGFFQKKKKKETHDFPHINFLRYHPALSGRPPLNIFVIDKINTFESFRQNKKKKKHVETVVSEAGKIGKLWLKKKRFSTQILWNRQQCSIRRIWLAGSANQISCKYQSGPDRYSLTRTFRKWCIEIIRQSVASIQGTGTGIHANIPLQFVFANERIPSVRGFASGRLDTQT